jgi:FkbM family methyltransferase
VGNKFLAVPYEDKNLMSMVLRSNEMFEGYVLEKIINVLLDADVHKENGFVILDIGTNVGSWTVGLADRLGNDTTIYSFDLFREYLDSLEISLRLNNFKQTKFVLHDIFLTDKEVYVNPIFSVSATNPSPERYNSSWTFNSFFGVHELREYSSLTIPAASLDHLYSIGEFPCPSFMRFDLDVHEFRALRGSERILLECHPMLLISVPCLDLVRPIVKFLERTGYHFGWLPGLECLDCYGSDWFARYFPNQQGSPYLLALPLEQWSIFNNLIDFVYPIDEERYFHNNIVHHGNMTVDLYQIHVSYQSSQGHPVDFLLDHANGSTMNRCHRLAPQDYLYGFLTVERQFPLHRAYLERPEMNCIDPIEEKYRSDRRNGGKYQIISSFQADSFEGFHSIDINRIRFISAYYDINRGNWSNRTFRRSVEDYFVYFEPYLMLDIDMIVFLESKFIPLMEKLIEECEKKGLFRISLTIFEMKEGFIESLPSYSYLSEEISIANSPEFQSTNTYQSNPCKECFNGYYTTAVHMKVDFIQLAINSFYTPAGEEQGKKEEEVEDDGFVYAWSDFGMFKRFDEIPSRPFNLTRIREKIGASHKLVVNGINPVFLYDPTTLLRYFRTPLIQDSIITNVLIGKTIVSFLLFFIIPSFCRFVRE